MPHLYEVWLTSVATTHDFVTAEDHAEIAKLVKEKYLPTGGLDIAVDENDKPLAFMGMTENEIDSLFVHENARGKGLGRLLVELAFRRAPVIRTEVNEQNHQAVAFWKYMGFRETGRSEIDGQGRPYPLLRMEWPDSESSGDLGSGLAADNNT